METLYFKGVSQIVITLKISIMIKTKKMAITCLALLFGVANTEAAPTSPTDMMLAIEIESTSHMPIISVAINGN